MSRCAAPIGPDTVPNEPRRISDFGPPPAAGGPTPGVGAPPAGAGFPAGAEFRSGAEFPAVAEFGAAALPAPAPVGADREAPGVVPPVAAPEPGVPDAPLVLPTPVPDAAASG